MSPPLLALTIGDPCGIGPEIALRLLAEGDVPARLLLVGRLDALERDAALVPGAKPPPRVASPEEQRRRALPAALWEPPAPKEPLPERGRVTAGAGALSHAWVEAGARLAMEGRVDGLVTGPIHKESWRAAGVESVGHTEALRRAAGVERVVMLLVGGPLRVALATIHVPLSSVPGILTTAGLVDALVLLHGEIGRWFGPSRPRIAVCGLNPHAGEHGLFGAEERDVIEPAVSRARGLGVEAWGPLAADACIPQAVAGAWDAVLAMYHDQGLVAVKALAPRRAVNVTLGLPFVRTSVDHGTAFDRAGAGTASAGSLREAVLTAGRMVRRGSGRRALNRPPSSSDLPAQG